MSKTVNVIFKTVVITVLTLYSLILFSLLYLTIVTSFKSLPDLMNNKAGLPQKWIFQNYIDAFSMFNVTLKNKRVVYLGEMFWNTILYAGGSAFFATLVPCLMAYCCAKFNVSLNKFIYGTVIVGMILPIVGALPSSIQICKALGIFNTMIGMWIMKANYMGTYFLIFYATFKSLSDEYKEAAIIDGANDYYVLLKIIFPLVKTVMLAVFTLNLISFWNDYQTPLIYLESYPTAAVGMFRFGGSSNGASLPNIQMTGCMILFIPIFVFYMAFRDLFIGNLTVGGLKG